MENNQTIQEIVKMINDESFYFRKQYGMHGGFSFHVTYLNEEMIFVTVTASHNQEKHEQIIRNFIFSMVRLLNDVIPVPFCQVTYYPEKNDPYPQFIRVYPFYRKSLMDVEYGATSIERDAESIRQKIKDRMANRF